MISKIIGCDDYPRVTFPSGTTIEQAITVVEDNRIAMPELGWRLRRLQRKTDDNNCKGK